MSGDMHKAISRDKVGQHRLTRLILSTGRVPLHTHLCCTAHKKNVVSPIFCANLRLEAPLPVYFLVRHPVTLPQLQPHF